MAKLDFFEFNKEVNDSIEKVLEESRREKYFFGRLVGLILITATGLVRNTFYGTKDGPPPQDWFDEHSSDLNDLIKEAEGIKIMSFIYFLSLVFIAIYCFRRPQKKKIIITESEKIFGIDGADKKAALKTTKTIDYILQEMGFPGQMNLWIASVVFFDFVESQNNKKIQSEIQIKFRFCSAIANYVQHAFIEFEKEKGV
jgi:hypothetical protein